MYQTLVRLTRRIIHPLGYDIVLFDPHGTFAQHIMKVLGTLQINVLLDVGANEGQYAAMLRKIGYRGWVFSFEPGPDAFAKLQKVAAKDRYWKVFNFALGSQAEQRDFYIYESSVFSSFHLPGELGQRRFSGATKIKEKVQVEIKRLDSVFESILAEVGESARIFLKMDTQGHDSEVIKGASGCIAKILGIQSELSVKPLYKEMENYRVSLDRFQELGFDLTGLFPLVRGKNHVLIEMDCVMVRPVVEAVAEAGAQTVVEAVSEAAPQAKNR